MNWGLLFLDKLGGARMTGGDDEDRGDNQSKRNPGDGVAAEPAGQRHEGFFRKKDMRERLLTRLTGRSPVCSPRRSLG